MTGCDKIALDRIMSDKEHVQELLGHLAPDRMAAVVRLLEVMLDPASRALASAPFEDEELSDEEKITAAQSREWLERNHAIPHAEVLSELGLTESDVARYSQKLNGEKDRLD